MTKEEVVSVVNSLMDNERKDINAQFDLLKKDIDKIKKVILSAGFLSPTEQYFYSIKGENL